MAAPHNPAALLRSFHSSFKSVKRQSTCALYSSPLASAELPVYEDITLTWDPSCVTITTDNIDLYLSVQEATGLVAVHEWTDVVYSDGKLDTQFKPSWWNASEGAGSVSAQVSGCSVCIRRDLSSPVAFPFASTTNASDSAALHRSRWFSILEHARTHWSHILHHLQWDVSRHLLSSSAVPERRR